MTRQHRATDSFTNDVRAVTNTALILLYFTMYYILCYILL